MKKRTRRRIRELKAQRDRLIEAYQQQNKGLDECYQILVSEGWQREPFTGGWYRITTTSQSIRNP